MYHNETTTLAGQEWISEGLKLALRNPNPLSVSIVVKTYISLRKHAHSNILKFLPPKKMKIFR